MAFVFSADGHIVEPSELLTDGLPPSLRRFGVRAEVRDGYRFMMAGDKITSKMPLNKPLPRMQRDGELFGRSDRRGPREVPMRIEDMALDGVDAEIVFPSLAITAFLIEDIDAEMATAQVYNDWHHEQLKNYPDKLVRCGILPVKDFRNTI